MKSRIKKMGSYEPESVVFVGTPYSFRCSSFSLSGSPVQDSCTGRVYSHIYPWAVITTGKEVFRRNSNRGRMRWSRWPEKTFWRMDNGHD